MAPISLFYPTLALIDDPVTRRRTQHLATELSRLCAAAGVALDPQQYDMVGRPVVLGKASFPRGSQAIVIDDPDALMWDGGPCIVAAMGDDLLALVDARTGRVLPGKAWPSWYPQPGYARQQVAGALPRADAVVLQVRHDGQPAFDAALLPYLGPGVAVALDAWREAPSADGSVRVFNVTASAYLLIVLDVDHPDAAGALHAVAQSQSLYHILIPGPLSPTVALEGPLNRYAILDPPAAMPC